MTERDKFINYVKNGFDKPFVSLHIGVGAGFDSKFTGRQWLSDATIEELSLTLGPGYAKFLAIHPTRLLVSKKQ